MLKNIFVRPGGPCQGPKPKRAFWSIKLPFLTKIAFWTRHSKMALPKKKNIFSTLKGLLEKKWSIWSPRALSKQTKALSETKRDPLEPRRNRLELIGPFGAAKGSFKQTYSFSDPKRAHSRPKMALWKQKRSFS